MGLLETVLTFRQVKILSAHIRADDQNGFHVAFEHHRDDVVEAEYIWIVLQYIAKVLFVQVRQDPFSAVVLYNAIDAALTEGLGDQLDIFKAADLDDVAGMRDATPARAAWAGRCTLYFIACTQRGVWTQFSRASTMQQGVYSALAVLQAACQCLGHDARHVLAVALAKMLIVSESVDWTRMDTLVNVPRFAYLDASCAV